jgi:hypothetical protein
MAGLAANLRVDTLTAEAVTALRSDGVRTVLLKGPAIARWLYDAPGDRTYADSDLLIAPGDVRRAERSLRRLGFRPGEWEAWLRRARSWSSARGTVDLHTSLFGLDASAEEAWSALSRTTEAMSVGGADVEVLALPARALHVAAHVAQHPASHAHAQAREDLKRAVERVSADTWDAAAALARELGAEAALAAGLHQVDGGAALAEKLGVDPAGSAGVALHAEDAPWTALGFAEIAAADSARLRIALAARAIVPTASSMRRYSALANRGRTGLALAYVMRTVRLASGAPAGFVQWRRAGR